MKKKMIIGITGTFGSGKSTVARMFTKYGFRVIDVDKLYRRLIRPNTELYRKIIDEFGINIIRSDKSIDRKRLKKIVFNDKLRLKKLNALTHNSILKKIEDKIIKTKDSNIIIDAPLLIEAKAGYLVDKIIVVRSIQNKIMQRLIKKGKYTKEEIKNISLSQIPINKKLKYADYIVDNSGSIKETKKEILNIIKNLKK